MSIPITSVRNAKYLEDGRIDLEINHPTYGWIPYTINDLDGDATISNSHLKLLLGNNIEPYVPPTQSELDDKAAFEVRMKRNEILEVEVDPIVSNQLRWEEMTVEKQNAWKQYRRSLLDITSQSGFPHSVTWPSKPN